MLGRLREFPFIYWTPAVIATVSVLVTQYPELVGMNKESFPSIDLSDIIGGDKGFTPSPQQPDLPGYQAPEMPIGNILNVDQPQLPPGERTRIGQELMDMGLWGNSNNTHIVITSPGTLGQFAEAAHRIFELQNANGLTREEAFELAAKQARDPAVGKALLEMMRMKDQVVLITDPDTLGVVKLTHNGNLEFHST